MPIIDATEHELSAEQKAEIIKQALALVGQLAHALIGLVRDIEQSERGRP